MVQMFGWEGWFTLAVLVVMFLCLLFNVAPADFVMLLALVVVMLAQIVDTKEGLEGFSSSAVLTVAVLYVVAAGINASGALEYFFNKLLGNPTSLAIAQLRMMIPVGLVSAFLNNTPVVAIMIPIVQSYANRIRKPVSQFFIPLSFASILGGTCTLIGTSTNLVIAGKYEQTYGSALGLFDLGTVGVPVLLTGFSYIVLFSPLLLPGVAELERRSRRALGLDSKGEDEGEHQLPPGIGSDFTVGCVVTEHSPAKGKAVDEAGLRGLDGLYLTSIQRNGRLFNAVGPEFVVNENDILFFTGLVDNFDDFCMRNGFRIITDANEDEHSHAGNADSHHHPEYYNSHGSHGSTSLEMRAQSEFVHSATLARDAPGSPAGPAGSLGPRSPSAMSAPGEPTTGRRLARAHTFDERIIKVVVRSGSSLEGQTAKEANFRRRYDAAIISLFRAGKKTTIHGNLGRIVLQVGDVLLLVTGNAFDWTDNNTKADLKPYVADSVAMHEAEDALDDGVPTVSDIEREFLIAMRVSEAPKLLGARSLVGQTIEAAGLRGLPGLFLIAIEHFDGTIEHVVGPDAVLRANDVVWFAGERGAVATLRRIPGLESPEEDQAGKLKVRPVHRRLVEAVLSLRSHLVGKTVREARFRTLYEAAIIAVHRQGRRVLSKIGDIELRAGDVLILDTGPNFVQKYRDDKNFLLVTEIDDSAPPRFDKFYIAVTATVLMIVIFLVASDYMTLFQPAVLAAGTMIAFDCLTPERARAAVSWDVIVTIACAFGLSNAMQNTGVATTVGEGLVRLAEITNTGFAGVLAAVYLAGFLISIVIANNATALLLFPIAATSAQNACPVGTNQDTCNTQMMYILMLSASSSFSSPYGYQTNTMVLNCGNYVFGDFLKFGFPMQFWQMVFSVLFVWFVDLWYYSWLISFCVFIAIVAFRVWRDQQTLRKADATAPTALRAEHVKDGQKNVDDQPSAGSGSSASPTSAAAAADGEDKALQAV